MILKSASEFMRFVAQWSDYNVNVMQPNPKQVKFLIGDFS